MDFTRNRIALLTVHPRIFWGLLKKLGVTSSERMDIKNAFSNGQTNLLNETSKGFRRNCYIT
jgi:hypothetical protein